MSTRLCSLVEYVEFIDTWSDHFMLYHTLFSVYASPLPPVLMSVQCTWTSWIRRPFCLNICMQTNCLSCCITAFGLRSFGSSGPTAWDDMLAHLRNSDLTLNDFRQLLKTTLFRTVLVYLPCVCLWQYFVNCAFRNDGSLLLLLLCNSAVRYYYK